MKTNKDEALASVGEDVAAGRLTVKEGHALAAKIEGAEAATSLVETKRSFQRFIYDNGEGSHHYIYLGRLHDSVSWTHVALKLANPGESFFPKCVGFESVAGVLWYSPAQ